MSLEGYYVNCSRPDAEEEISICVLLMNAQIHRQIDLWWPEQKGQGVIRGSCLGMSVKYSCTRYTLENC